MRKTKIVCTLGPASNSYNQILALIKAGMNVARINMSHGELSSHKQVIDNIKKARQKSNMPCAIMIDTRGPEIRIGEFEKGKETLIKGQQFILTSRNVIGNNDCVSLRDKSIINNINIGQKIYINNGLVELKVRTKNETDLVCKVIIGGEVSNNKSISIPKVAFDIPYISEIDKEHIKFALEQEAEYLALSFVSNAEEIKSVKELIGDSKIKLIAKIENAQGIKNIDKILEACDGIMVARGDMGTEIALDKVPLMQKELISHALTYGKISITATEMLESMTYNRRPTRAEVSDVANAIYDGTSAIMLSGETAVGRYPIETVATMSKIAQSTEESIDYHSIDVPSNQDTISDSVAYSAVNTASFLGAKAIVVYTMNGVTVPKVAQFMPHCPIIAVTHDNMCYNQLALVWGTYVIKEKLLKRNYDMFKYAEECVKKLKIAKSGDKIVITAGSPVEARGESNLIKISIVD